MPKQRQYQELFELFAAIDTPTEAQKLLEDILTPHELESLTERWQEIKLLARGMTQRDIAKKLGISISKVSRGSNALKYGTGGFARMLQKLKKPRQMTRGKQRHQKTTRS